MIAIFIGRLLLVDPEIDVRVKLTDLMLRVMVPLSFNKAKFDRSLMSKANPDLPVRLEDGVNAVDFLLPAAEQSCYEGTNKTDTVKARLYYAEGVNEKRPIVIYFHGGGMALGSGMDYNADTVSRNLVKTGKVVVLSVDYRLAPEYFIPDAIDDCISAVLWVHKYEESYLKQYVDPSKIVLMGDSAGGYLGAVVTYYIRQNYPDIPIVYQILAYPAMNLKESTPSRVQFANGYILFTEFIQFFKEAHNPKTPEFQESTLYRPLNAPSLKDMPPTHIILADHDFLLDEGKMYYGKLLQDGVKATLKVYEHATHGFFTFHYLPQAQQAWKDLDTILELMS